MDAAVLFWKFSTEGGGKIVCDFSFCYSTSHQIFVFTPCNGCFLDNTCSVQIALQVLIIPAWLLQNVAPLSLLLH